MGACERACRWNTLKADATHGPNMRILSLFQFKTLEPSQFVLFTAIMVKFKTKDVSAYYLRALLVPPELTELLRALKRWRVGKSGTPWPSGSGHGPG